VTFKDTLPAQIGNAFLSFAVDAISPLIPNGGRALPATTAATIAEPTLAERIMGIGITPQVNAVSTATAGETSPPAAPVVPTGDSVLSLLPFFSTPSLRPSGTNPMRRLTDFDPSDYLAATVGDPEIEANISTGDINAPGAVEGQPSAMSGKIAGLPWWLWLVAIFTFAALVAKKK